MNKECYLKSTPVPPLSGRRIPPLTARTKPLAVLPSREMLATSAVQSVQAALNDLESRYQVNSN